MPTASSSRPKTPVAQLRELRRDKTSALQVNVGRLCNLACKHCHVDAGPGRTEVMSRQTMDEVVRFAGRVGFAVIDITGGAPELAPGINNLIDRLAPLCDRLLFRTNLTLLLADEAQPLLDLCRQRRVTLIASFPSVNRSQADAQRGGGVFDQSIDMLRRLNQVGYGLPGSGLELDLVSNPAGAFLPADQCAAEIKFKTDLARRWDIQFNRLFTFANVPLGRYRLWLQKSGNLAAYLEKLLSSFNPDTLAGLMCRTQISVSWDGFLFDCDFNLAAGLPYGGGRIHISEVSTIPAGQTIMTGDHCFACTAGAGFT